ncbi:hypothetical protein LEP1GSC165_0086, partial [Leptospira santarosai str. CBC523]
EKSEKYQELADKAKSEAKFDEAALYTGYAVREKNNALGYLKKKYYTLGEEITTEVENRGLNFTKNSFLSYRDTLLNKNFQNTTQVQKQIQEGKNQVAGIIAEGESYNQIQGMIQTAQNLNHQGEENKEKVEKATQGIARISESRYIGRAARRIARDDCKYPRQSTARGKCERSESIHPSPRERAARKTEQGQRTTFSYEFACDESE